METLKDIKEVLSKIPDDDLERFKFGCGEGSEDKVSLMCMNDGDDPDHPEKDYHVIWDKYPELSKLSNLIENIKKAQGILDDQGNKSETLSEDLQQDGITDTYFNK